MTENYPELRLLLKKQTNALSKKGPATVKAFNGLHEATMGAGALTGKVKELIALGIAIADRCDACISFHVHEALACGATDEEIAECIGVAVLMGGGPSLMYGAKAMDAVRQFRNDGKEASEEPEPDMNVMTD
ncbi:MAG: carboxymuconolactone decarboxylase family protein [Capsulimonadales bacterium]|nr:carboxymuconolactone decarboxylase family protein [Capsulimonadales bacterium]